jgi:hypothetical protein
MECIIEILQRTVRHGRLSQPPYPRWHDTSQPGTSPPTATASLPAPPQARQASLSDVVSPRTSSWRAVLVRSPPPRDPHSGHITRRGWRRQVQLTGETTGLCLLPSRLSQDLWPTELLLMTCVFTGAAAAVILVILVGKENRVDAIRATADLLYALLPWRARHRDRKN